MRQTRDRTQIDPIRIATNTALKPIRVGTGPDVIAITPSLSTACLSCR